MSEPTLRPHEFDGIQEYDNHLPNWWLWSFYLACIFSVGYWIHYHTLGTGNSPMDAYHIEQEEAAAKLEAILAANPVTEESLLRLAAEPATVAQGAELYKVNCVECHASDGTAKGASEAAPLPGVNLTDGWWLHGADPMSIYKTINEGAENGMQAWGPRLGRSKVTKLVAYVLKELQGKDRPGRAPNKERAKLVEQND